MMDFQKFPGNDHVYKKLKELFQDERLRPIAFVGAGASAGLYPLWGQLITMLIDFAVQEAGVTPQEAARWKSDTDTTPQRRVTRLQQKLGDALFNRFLMNTFRKSKDGRLYTEVHAALLRLPFRGYVTTNYDSALDCARAKLRATTTTGMPTWQHTEIVADWRNGDIFLAEDCPMLWLHGHWQAPGGIVLNVGSYGEAYTKGIYRSTFRELWLREHMVFCGFGFNDPQFKFMVPEFLYEEKEASALPRHVAILGWEMPGDGAEPDPGAVQEKREDYEAEYKVRILFYPVYKGDHSELGRVLESLLADCGCAVPAPAPVPVCPPPATHAAPASPPAARASTPAAPAAPASPPAASVTRPAVPAARPPAPVWREQWIHAPSNDTKFIGREDEMALLNRWVRDPAVRMVAVCAVGGTGKTALVGHWLQKTDGWRCRDFAGLFAWSFYQNKSTEDFLDRLLLWAHAELGWSTDGHDDACKRTAAARLLREKTLVLVLDGLEVLQDASKDGAEDLSHGNFLDADLRGLLHALGEAETTQSLAVLTSRFTFPDLERHLGTTLHRLDLGGLPEERGAELLYKLKVDGKEQERRRISTLLEGHPLALRIFAQALPEGGRSKPMDFLERVFRVDTLQEDSPLHKKMRNLLRFYEKRLPQEQVRLLSIVSLFRAPVAEATVLRLARALPGAKGAPALPDDAALSRALKMLHGQDILNDEPLDDGERGYACHPILRDHFRSLIVNQGAAAARTAADLLAGPPASEPPQSVKDIEPVLLAIELLLDAGEFKAADDLYVGRLYTSRVFKNLPAPREGAACALGFVRDASRQRACEEKLSPRRLSFYLNDVGLYSMNHGDYQGALESYRQSGALYQAAFDSKSISIVLHNQSELHWYLGEWGQAANAATKALEFAENAAESISIKIAFAFHGAALAACGQVRQAAEFFAQANALEKQHDPDGDELYSLCGVQWSELLMRSGQATLAERRTRANLNICQHGKWNNDIAWCNWLLAACALVQGRIEDAAEPLAEAERILQRAQMVYWLAKVHLTAGELALAQNDAREALHRAAEALDLACPRGMRGVHADALVLRGRARLLEAKKDAPRRALDDAEAALALARECEYLWAERDALRLQAAAHGALAAELDASAPEQAGQERLAADKASARAEALARKLVLTDEDLAQADREAEAWLAAWNRKQEEAKSKAEAKPKATPKAKSAKK